ncbi:MAG: thiamine pyrophosphate-dependent enzyme [Hyphomicrobiaceae bacterium]
MERSYAEEIAKLELGSGETFHGEGILAVTKALLQSGVAYVGGYQGAPVTALLDVLVSAKDTIGKLGVHVEACANEASAAAMLAASINYPVRGAVTWKSIVGTNVASDALSNLASVGVKGGALIVVGEDYGEGASVIQERSLAFALKSTLIMLDPRPDLPTIVSTVEHAFAMSEASSMPAMMQLRIRACHVQGEFVAKDNVAPAVSALRKLAEPAPHDYGRLAHPPVTFPQEHDKIARRLPAARDYIIRHGLNESVAGSDPNLADIGIILQGGVYNTVVRQLVEAGLSDPYGNTKIPLYVLNVTWPLVPDEIVAFAREKRAVLVIEEGSPEFIEHGILQAIAHSDVATKVAGKDIVPPTGEVTGETAAKAIAEFLRRHSSCAQSVASVERLDAVTGAIEDARSAGAKAWQGALPPRGPTFCTGCPERPVFGAMKLVERDIGKVHYAADIGCHAFATFQPFGFGNSILGYGMSLASNAAVTPVQEKRTIAVMGDGGFWHNGVQTGVASAIHNKSDGVLVIMQNGYSSATGQQWLPSSGRFSQQADRGMDIERHLKAMGIRWLKTVRTYSVSKMVAALKDALTTTEAGLKVIIAESECMLARKRRENAEDATRLKAGRRVEKARFGVDDSICTGDHSCIRMSGCPSLTIKPNPDPLRTDPVAAVNQGCVACGLCGEMAHAAVLCPSFYRAQRTMNAGWWERRLHRLRQSVIARLAGNV